MVSQTKSEIAARLNFIFTPFTGVNITLNMIMHKKKEANTENFGSTSPSWLTNLLSKNDTSKKDTS